MDILKSRIGLLFSPVEPLHVLTVVSYSSLALTVSGKTGITTALIGMAIETANGFLARIKDVDISGADAIFSLAPNAATFTALDTVYIYNVRRPFPKFQKVTLNTITETEDVSGLLTGWVINGITDDNSDSKTLYWTNTKSGGAYKIKLFWDSARTDGLVAATDGYMAAGTVTFTERNDSGLSGSVVVDGAAGDDQGTIVVGGAEIYQDWDISWDSLGADDDARSYVDQGPVGVVEPAAVWCEVGEDIAFSAESYATYYGYPGGGPRSQATVPGDATGHAWDAGTGGTVTGTGPNVSVAWSTMGFRYLKYTVTDSKGSTQDRYIPVWVGMTPIKDVLRCSARWRANAGWTFEIAYQYRQQTPDDRLTYAQCAVVDLETQEVLFSGFVWPESVTFDFEKSQASFQVLSDLAYLGNVPGTSMRLQGQEGSPMQWFVDTTVAGNFDWLNAWRGALWMLRNHSNYLELANVRMPLDSLEPTAISDDRKEYIRDYPAGTLLQQLTRWAGSFMFILYGRRLGGFDAILNPLYSETITTAADDAVCVTLATDEVEGEAQYEKPTHTMDELRASGFYHTGNPSAGYDFLPVCIRAPEYCDGYGNVDELAELRAMDNTTTKGTYTGYQEMIVWSGRHIGLANTAYKYTVLPLVDIEIPTYLMLDVPNGDRVVMEEQTLEHDARALRWNFVCRGRTFGKTYGAAVETQPTPPSDPNPPDDPLPTPIPPTTYGDGSKVALALEEKFLISGTRLTFVATGSKIQDSSSGLGKFRIGDKFTVTLSGAGNNGTKTVASTGTGEITISEAVFDESGDNDIRITSYMVQVAVSDNFNDAVPDWALVDTTGLPEASITQDERRAYCVEFANGGTYPNGLYLSIDSYNAVSGDVIATGHVFWNPDPFGTGTWIEITGLHSYSDGGDVYAHHFTEEAGVNPAENYYGPIIQADPLGSGECVINTHGTKNDVGVTGYRGYCTVLDGALVETGSKSGIRKGTTGGSRPPYILGWDRNVSGNILTGSAWLYFSPYSHVLSYPKTTYYDLQTDQTDGGGNPTFSTNANIVGGDDGGDLTQWLPLWLYQNSALLPVVAGAGLYFYARNYSGGSYYLHCGYLTQQATMTTAIGSAITNFMYFGVIMGQCPNALGKATIALIESGNIFIEENYLASHNSIAVPGGASTLALQVLFFGGSDDGVPYVAVVSQDGSNYLEDFYVSTKVTTWTGAWSGKKGTGATGLLTLIPGAVYFGPKPMAVFWGEETP